MTSPPRQLVLDLAHRPALGAEDFLVSRSNGAAVALVDSWPDWQGPAQLVVGPPRAGKTHLAHVWQLRSGADIVDAGRLDESAVQAFAAKRALVVEDIDRGVADERTLFHLLNLAREHQGALLVTSARPTGELQIALPDLRSRLRALPAVAIEAPDEELLHAVLVKLFSDRQLAVEPHVIAHCVRHMERSMAFAARLVEVIDGHALATHRKVTRALAGEALAALAGGSADPAAGAD